MLNQHTAPPDTSRRCYCGVRHRKWTAIARCRWPRAIWVYGNGPWASVAHCVAARAEAPYFGRAYRGSQTVALYQTREDAQLVLRAGPSGHELVDLEAGL